MSTSGRDSQTAEAKGSSQTGNTAASVELGVLAEQAFEAVLFDLDGTLIDSTPAIVRSWAICMTEHGVDPDKVERPHGVPSAQIVRLLLRGASEEQLASASRCIEQLEVDDTADIVVLPGAADALKVLARRSAIATSGTRPLAVARITAAGFTSPAVVVTADDVERGKPAPDPFLEAAPGAELTADAIIDDLGAVQFVVTTRRIQVR